MTQRSGSLVTPCPQSFDRAVAEVSEAARKLLTSLHTHAPARDREVEAEKAKERSRLRFG